MRRDLISPALLRDKRIPERPDAALVLHLPLEMPRIDRPAESDAGDAIVVDDWARDDEDGDDGVFIIDISSN